MYYEDIIFLLLPNIDKSHLKTYCFYNIKNTEVKLFQFKLFKYIFDSKLKEFQSIKFEFKSSNKNIVDNFSNGLSSKEVEYQRLIFGACDLNFKIETIFELILKEVSDPFYLFQVFSIILWSIEDYYKYAVVIIITTILSLGISVYETRVNLVQIQTMAKYTCKVSIFRENRVNYKYLNIFY